MSDLADTVNQLLKGAKGFATDNFCDLIQKCESDELDFNKDLGQRMRRAVEALAAGKIDKDEFTDLANDCLSLEKIQAADISVQAKVKTQGIVMQLRKLALDSLCKLI